MPALRVMPRPTVLMARAIGLESRVPGHGSGRGAAPSRSNGCFRACQWRAAGEQTTGLAKPVTLTDGRLFRANAATRSLELNQASYNRQGPLSGPAANEWSAEEDNDQSGRLGAVALQAKKINRNAARPWVKPVHDGSAPRAVQQGERDAWLPRQVHARDPCQHQPRAH